VLIIILKFSGLNRYWQKKEVLSMKSR